MAEKRASMRAGSMPGLFEITFRRASSRIPAVHNGRYIPVCASRRKRSHIHTG
ncbi:MAG: hypothetical protein H0U65_16750 [Rubrobacter sp.]|nr:hypothetical protein [Rubrobacter sp.]